LTRDRKDNPRKWFSKGIIYIVSSKLPRKGDSQEGPKKSKSSRRVNRKRIFCFEEETDEGFPRRNNVGTVPTERVLIFEKHVLMEPTCCYIRSTPLRKRSRCNAKGEGILASGWTAATIMACFGPTQGKRPSAEKLPDENPAIASRRKLFTRDTGR